MRLLEFQAKRLLREQEIPVPNSKLLISSEDLDGLSYPIVLKAQVPVGGRGKAGAIKTVFNAQEAASTLRALLDTTVKDHPVKAVLAEEKVAIEKELYLSFLIDKHANRPMVMASAAGGMDIEEVAQRSPQRIIKKHVTPCPGLPNYLPRFLAKRLGAEAHTKAFVELFSKLFYIFQAYDATLVEINPLVVTPTELMALDVKILLDDKARFRQGERFDEFLKEQAPLVAEARSEAERLAEEKGITYVKLDGTVGMISDGAGTGMLALDLIKATGGEAANFCELGVFGGPETMRDAMEVVLANSQTKALLISLIGGLTRMDEVAEGIVAYLQQNEVCVPLVVRMCGTEEERGKEVLRAVGIQTLDDLPTAVRTAVSRAKG